MKVKFFMKGKNGLPVFCCMYSEKQKIKESDFAFVERVLKKHEEDLFDEPVYRSGIANMITTDENKSSFRERDGSIKWGKPVSFGDIYSHKDSNIYIGADIVSEGWILKISGVDNKFFQKINRRTVRTCASKCDARLYQSLYDLRKEILAKEHILAACAKSFGWSMSLLEGSDEFRADYEDRKAHGELTEKEKRAMQDIEEALKRINLETVTY